MLFRPKEIIIRKIFRKLLWNSLSLHVYFYSVTWREASLIGNCLISLIKYNLWLTHKSQNILTVSNVFPQIKTL